MVYGVVGTGVWGTGTRCGSWWVPVVWVRVLILHCFPHCVYTVPPLYPPLWLHWDLYDTTVGYTGTPLWLHWDSTVGYTVGYTGLLGGQTGLLGGQTDSLVARLTSLVARLTSLATILGCTPWRFPRSTESVSLRLWVRPPAETAIHPEMT